MVYAACGVSSLYNDHAEGYARSIIPVQPIFKTEGKSMLATCLVKEEKGGLGASKVGVIYSNDDTGNPIWDAIQDEAKKLNVTITKSQSVDAQATDYSAQVNAIKAAGCDALIIASAQPVFSKVAAQVIASNYDNVKLITSYVSANTGTMGALTAQGLDTETRKVYGGAWLDINDPTNTVVTEGAKTIAFDTYKSLGFDDARATYLSASGFPGFSSEYWEFADMVYLDAEAYERAGLDINVGKAYWANSYAMAGVLAAQTFTTGIERLLESKKEITWLNYLDAMEEAPVKVSMTKGGSLDLSEGKRFGVTSFSLAQYVQDYVLNKDGSYFLDENGNKVMKVDQNGQPQAAGITLRGLTSIEDLEKLL